MHEVLVNRLGGLSLPRKSVVKLTNRPELTLAVYRGQQQQQFMKAAPYDDGKARLCYMFVSDLVGIPRPSNIFKICVNVPLTLQNYEMFLSSILKFYTRIHCIKYPLLFFSFLQTYLASLKKIFYIIPVSLNTIPELQRLTFMPSPFYTGR